MSKKSDTNDTVAVIALIAILLMLLGVTVLAYQWGGVATACLVLGIALFIVAKLGYSKNG